MKKHTTNGILPYFVLAILALGMSVNAYGQEVGIEVSPNILNIPSDGNVVTVHTDVPYSQVLVHSVFLNGVPINTWKADSRGYFVAKFVMEEVKYLSGLVIGDYNELTLTGMTTNHTPFAGTDAVLVVDNVPQGGR